MRKLYIQQKIFKLLDNYPITDEAGNIVYQVDQKFRLLGHAVTVTDAQGQILFSIEEELFTLLPRFQVHFPDGRALTIRARFSLWRQNIDIDPENLGLNLQGDFFSHDFTLTQNKQTVGSIKKGWFT